MRAFRRLTLVLMFGLAAALGLTAPMLAAPSTGAQIAPRQAITSPATTTQANPGFEIGHAVQPRITVNAVHVLPSGHVVVIFSISQKSTVTYNGSTVSTCDQQNQTVVTIFGRNYIVCSNTSTTSG